MSPHRKRCAVRRVLQELNEKTTHHPQRRRNTVFDPHLQDYVTKKLKRRTHLQSVLSTEPNKYDFEWFGDGMETTPKTNLRFWFQNCNGLVTKGDTREFQFDVANMADSGVNYFSFLETCVNSNKPDYAKK